jgi:hypothetical protein
MCESLLSIFDCSQIRASVIEALEAFAIEHHQLEMLPKAAIEGLDPEQPLEGIPGSCWISLITNSKKEDPDEVFNAYEGLLRNFVKEELIQLPRSVYHLSQSMKNRSEEHPNYNYLSETSLLRCIVAHLIHNGKDKINRCLINILSLSNERPLPPLDWRMLKNQMTNDSHSFIGILARQCSSSISAKSMLENFLSDWSGGEVALDIMPYVKYVVKGVSAASLEPHILESAILWYQSFTKDKSCFNGLKSLIKSYVSIVKDEDVEDRIKESVIKAILQLHEELLKNDAPEDTVDEFKESFFKVIIDLPVEVLEKMADPFLHSTNYVSGPRMMASLAIRNNMAKSLSESPLPHMNAIIDYFARNDIEDLKFDFALKTLIAIFKCAKMKKQEKDLQHWLLEIMSQILLFHRENGSEDLQKNYTTDQDRKRTNDPINRSLVLYNTFIATLAVMSDLANCGTGFETRNALHQHLPYILNGFMRVEKYQNLGPRMAEWMLEMVNNNFGTIHNGYSYLIPPMTAFKMAERYKEASIWGRITVKSNDM